MSTQEKMAELQLRMELEAWFSFNADLLRVWRRNKKYWITQDVFARDAGVHKMLIVQVECGRLAAIATRTLQRIREGYLKLKEKYDGSKSDAGAVGLGDQNSPPESVAP